MNKNAIRLTVFILAILIILPTSALARAGGGGSSGGGGGGGGSSFGGSDSSSFRSTSFPRSGTNTSTSSDYGNSRTGVDILFNIIFFLSPLIPFGFFALIVYLLFGKKIKQNLLQRKAARMAIQVASQKDSTWNEEVLVKNATDVFYKFQKAWGEIDTSSMSKILDSEMYKRIVLELTVLKNEKRINPTEITRIISASIIKASDNQDNAKDRFSISFTASANDRLIELETENVLYSDNSVFTETWDFIRNGNEWLLAAIHQSTEDPNSLIPKISDFAKKNKFYYNPDFGWLMIPTKGVLFKDVMFGVSDINNHVIGFYRDKVVEFYTMVIDPTTSNGNEYLIAQAILPIKYNDILIRRKRMLQFGPSGLRKHEMESNDFMKEYEVYSDENDNISTFELLSPNFMEKIMNLPFRLTIEVVGNTLYLSTEDNGADYEKMLEILSYAFDEMKM